MKFYPIVATLEIHITDGKGSNGQATYECPFNRLPTEEEMPRILEEVKALLPEGYRLMTRHESFIHHLRENKGYRGPNNIAMPSMKEGDEWHDPETANVYMASDEDQYEEDEQ